MWWADRPRHWRCSTNGAQDTFREGRQTRRRIWQNICELLELGASESLRRCPPTTLNTKPHIRPGARLHILVGSDHPLHITPSKEATYRCTVLDFDLHSCLQGRV